MKWTPALLAALLVAACRQAAPDPVDAESPPPVCSLAPHQSGAFVKVPPGQFRKGAYAVYPEETPEIILHVEGFEMLAHEVTNAEFARFVEASGYVTEAERRLRGKPEEAGSAVFTMPSANGRKPGSWQLSAGATWRSPEGEGSSIDGRGQEPVVHVTLADARAYATWAGGRLPTEEEWEYAAAIGLPDPADPQSGAVSQTGELRANTWQGFFPLADDARDGFAGRAPVGCFAPSQIGLYDMIGNVWEWTDTPFGEASHTIKGGSYLCADNFCRRYRPAARQPQEADFSSSHIGFRIVR